MITRQIIQCLFLIFYFQSTTNLKVLNKLNDPSRNKSTLKFLENLANGRHSNDKYSKKMIFFKLMPENKHTETINVPYFNIKSKLINRKIPYNYKPQYVYNSKQNSLYKPLIRFHVKKPIEKELNHQEKSNFLGYIVVVNENRKKRPLTLKPVTKTIIGAAFPILDKYLRSKSLESDEDIMDASIQAYEKRENLESDEKKVKFPEYYYWNYWTYGKTIHEGECKDPTLVKLGEMCISPHYESRKLFQP